MPDGARPRGIFCPACGSDNLVLSRSRSLKEDVLRTLLPVGFFRCRSCDWRGKGIAPLSLADWLARLWTHKGSVALVILFMVVATLSAYQIWSNHFDSPPTPTQPRKVVPYR